jgi:hypothetical protein
MEMIQKMMVFAPESCPIVGRDPVQQIMEMAYNIQQIMKIAYESAAG